MTSPIKPIYLDYHATTPVDPRVLEAMMPYFGEHFGNPASRSHTFGWQASEAVEIARGKVAALIATDSQNIIFTSGATEGLNMIIKGLVEASGSARKHIISVATEHHAVLDPLQWLQHKGCEVTLLPVANDGRIDTEQLKLAVRKDTLMVIVMWANNETGVVQDMKSIGALCKEAGIPLISDATQALGKIDVNPVENGVDIIAFSAHKMYGPKGVGAIYINPSLKIKPAALIHGGGHERGFRSGTLNVPGIVGLGAATQFCDFQKITKGDTIHHLRDHFESLILTSLEAVSINGNKEHRLPTVSNIKVQYVDSQAVMTRFRSLLAISSGSACSSINPEPSHVLLAMGLTAAEAKGSFRISMGLPTTREEVEKAAALLSKAIQEERSQSPVWQMFKQGIDLS